MHRAGPETGGSLRGTKPGRAAYRPQRTKPLGNYREEVGGWPVTIERLERRTAMQHVCKQTASTNNYDTLDITTIAQLLDVVQCVWWGSRHCRHAGALRAGLRTSN